MIRRMVFSLLATILLTGAFTLPVLPNSCGVDLEGRPIPCPEADGGGVKYIYDSDKRTFFPVPPGREGSETYDGVVWMVRYVVLCGTNDPDQPYDVLCVEATCESDGGLGYLTQVYRRESAADPWEPWPGRERTCRTFSAGEPIPLEDVEAEIVAIFEEHYEAVTRPRIDVAPAFNAVVNLPVIAATDDVGPVSFEIENPLPGLVEASPGYAWSWSNGSGGSGPGRAYDGTDPLAKPEHYPIRAVYSRAGQQEVALEATWAVTLTVEGIPPITDIEPLVYAASETFAVHSARTVLVD